MAELLDLEAGRLACIANRTAKKDGELRPCDSHLRYLRDATPGARCYCTQCRTFGMLESGGTIQVSRKAPPRPPVNADDVDHRQPRRRYERR